MTQVTIRPGDVPALYPQLTTAQIKALPHKVLELGARQAIGLKLHEGEHMHAARVYEVDWGLADELFIYSLDGVVFAGHVEDCDDSYVIIALH